MGTTLKATQQFRLALFPTTSPRGVGGVGRVGWMGGGGLGRGSGRDRRDGREWKEGRGNSRDMKSG